MKLRFARLEFVRQDCWVGAYWRTTYAVGRQFDLWICAIPMLPLHVRLVAAGPRGDDAAN